MKQRHYKDIKARVELMNRFWRGTLARMEAARKRKKKYELILLGKSFDGWRQVSKLWRKERIYRENVTARLESRGISEKIEDWSERRDQEGYEATYLSQFPPAVPISEFPTRGAHLENTALLKSWQPPLEWAVDRKALRLRRQRDRRQLA